MQRKIQDEGGDGDERRDILLIEGVLVMLAELFYGSWSLRSRDAAETELTGPVQAGIPRCRCRLV